MRNLQKLELSVIVKSFYVFINAAFLFSAACVSAGLGIYKRKNENTQERKHARVHANTHENTQKRTRSRKHARKHALVQESVHEKKNCPRRNGKGK